MREVIIVGSGLTAATICYFLNKNNIHCTIFEKNSFVSGMCHCDIFKNTVTHMFGPHIFHTDNKEIWNFVNKHCSIKPIKHTVSALYKNELYTLPINKTTLLELNGKSAYDYIIKEYTQKQWLIDDSLVSNEIKNRLIVRSDTNNSYFNDAYVGIPNNGWDELILNLLKHNDIVLNHHFFKKESNEFIIWTGRIDEYYNYCFGELDWIGRDFHITEYSDWKYPTPVINFTSLDNPWLRCTNYTMLNNSNDSNQICIYEKSIIGNKNNHFYFIQNENNNILLNKYQKCIDKNVIFAGRLGECKYYDMDDCIKRGFNIAKEALKLI